MIEQNEEELKQFRVQAILSEYQALRNNILQKFHHHLQIYSLIITVFAVMFSYIFTEKNYDLLLLIPVISSAFAFRYIWEQNIIEIIGNYLKIMEDEILPEVIGLVKLLQKEYVELLTWVALAYTSTMMSTSP